MATVDSLDIQISAQVTKANASLTTLINRLDRVSASLTGVNTRGLATMGSGVNKLANAMSNFAKNTRTADFTRLAKNLQSISQVDTSKFSQVASSISSISASLNGLGSVSDNAVQISEVAKNIAKLGNKSVVNAINVIPQLSTALSEFMTVMSRSPVVSQDVIDMTNALANLADEGRSVGSATRTLTNGLKRTNASMTSATKKAKSLAAAFGKFYATYFLVIKGIKSLGKAIESTANYFEALNYFNVAFDKIADEWSQDYKKYGYENAEAYAESFTDRMEKTFSQLSGVQFDTEKGLLSDTGIKNLGLNIQEVTQYASQLASVTNSLKLTGEASLATASAFTKLAGDMSSLFNVDYADVSANLQSGLIGQSRALYKYGIDITNATLQTKAYELGLSKAVSEMTQGEKAQLRLLSILEQSKVAWGDQSNTINSLSNQLRLLKNGWSETSMILGQLFVPMLENVLPVINGLVIAIKRLLVNMASLLGIKIDPNKFNQGLNETDEALDGLTEGFGDATEAAKAYENQLLGFDEINKLTDNTDTGSLSGMGATLDLTEEILKATEEYEKKWQKAYDNMQNNAIEWADVITESFSKIPSKFSKVITSFKRLGNAIQSLDGLAPLAEGFGKGFTDFFDFLINDVGSTVIDGLSFVIENFGKAIDKVDPTILKNIGKSLGVVAGAFLAFKVGSTAYVAMKKVYTLLSKYKKLGEIAITVTIATVGFDVGKMINEAITGASEYADTSIMELFNDIVWSITNGTFADDWANAWSEILDYPLGAIADWWVFDVSPWFTKEKWRELWNNIKGGFKEGWNNVKQWWQSTAIMQWWNNDVAPWFSKAKWTFTGIKDGLKKAFNNAIDAIKGIWNGFAEWINDALTLDFKGFSKKFEVLGKEIEVGIPKFSVQLGHLPTFYANGGFPEVGELFIANEAGPEWIGTMGNKTAVAPSNDIAKGIEEAAYRGMSRALAESSSNSNVNVTLQGDAKKFFTAMQREATNYSMQTRQPAFPT